MDADHINHKQPHTTLWLSQRLCTPFQEDKSLAAGTKRYDGDSAGENWPTFEYTKAHRLHDIRSLCNACDKIDVTTLTEGGPPIVLRDSFFEIARTASRCRFCSLIAQSTRGVSGTDYKADFLYTMGNRDAVDDRPVYLELQDGRLNVYVPYPEDWSPDSFHNQYGWDLGSFRIRVGEGIVFISYKLHTSGHSRGLGLSGEGHGLKEYWY